MARNETWAFVRRPRVGLVFVAAMALIAAVAVGGDALQQAIGGRPAASWWTPFVLGLGLGGFPCLMWITVTSADGSASWRIGAEAERWTAEALDGLGPSWRIEHDVPFPELGYVVNVDHVAIGPHGVLVVETKWTSHTIDLGARRLPAEVLHALDQARDNAGRIDGLLQRVNVPTTMIPVVVYWGPHVTPPAEPVRREDGVRLVAGGHGSEWLGLLSLDRLGDAHIDRLANRVRDWRVEHEDDGVRSAVAARLHHADRLGEVSVGLTALMVALVVLTRASDVVNTILGLGGVMLAAAVTLLPPIAALAAGTYVWLARQLDPDVPWIPRVIPIGVWSVGFAALLLAT